MSFPLPYPAPLLVKPVPNIEVKPSASLVGTVAFTTLISGFRVFVNVHVTWSPAASVTLPDVPVLELTVTACCDAFMQDSADV